jgi:hypothetical protein
MPEVQTIRDSFEGGREALVERIGNAYFFRPHGVSNHDRLVLANIRDWGNNRMPKTKRLMREGFEARGLRCETSYDAAHGRRYALCVYPAGEHARRVTLAAKNGMSDTDPARAAPIFQED